jgi:hypothetical protein
MGITSDPSKSKGSVWLAPSPANIKFEGNTTTYTDITMLRAAPERKYTLTDGTLTIFPED